MAAALQQQISGLLFSIDSRILICIINDAAAKQGYAA